MKKLKRIVLSILIVIGGVFIGACSCNNDNDTKNSQGQTPVYQGMVISSTVSEARLSNMSNYLVSLLDNDKEKNPNYKNGHYYHDHHGCEIPDGGYAGDSEDRNDNIDEERPFDEQTPSIEEKVDQELVIGSEKDIYYASLNEDIYVTIKLSNPDNYEIMSFTLNGNKYSSYMFEKGSDMENLILKVNVGNQAGIREYTIDAIKYIDGTEIKDVIMDGDKTVKAGIRTNNMVTASVTNQEVSLTSLSFDLTLNDGYSLIEKSNGLAKVLLYNGSTIIDNKDVVVGNNEIELTNLIPNTLYQYAIVASYDDLTGSGLENHVLYKDAFYTNIIVMFERPTITQTGITWDYIWDESVIDQNLVKQELYLDDEKIQDIDISTRELSNLLSNRAYTIKTTYTNLDNENEVINLYFVTEAKGTPRLEIVDVTSTQTSISFDLDITDTDNVGELTKLELLHGTDAPLELDVTDREVTGLLSNNDYTIRATCTYDLNDGEGVQIIVKTTSVKTNSKVTPVVEIVDVTSTQTSISFDLDITDTDNVGELTKLELLHGTDAPVELDLEDREITGLLSNNDYTIRATYTYNLNDGEGNKTIVVDRNHPTLSREVTVMGLSILNSSNPKVGEEVHVRIYLNNPDSVEITDFYLNGVKTEVLSGDRITNAILKFIPDTEGGEYEVKLTAVNYTVKGINVSQNLSTEYVGGIIVLGELKFVDINVATNDYNYVSPTEKTFKVTLNNPTKYEIISVRLSLSNMSSSYWDVDVIMDENKSSFTFESPIINSGWTLEYIKYGIGDVTGSLNISKSVQVKYIASSEIIEVSTPEQLANMKEDRIYSLKNDIDLANVKWEGYGVRGIVLGNGHKILNLSIVVENELDAIQYYGLFSFLDGAHIYDLKIENAYISVKTPGSVYAGILAGYNDNFDEKVENVSVSGDIYVTITGNAGTAYVGGIVGYISTMEILNTHSDVDIDVVLDHEGTTSCIGGIAGFSSLTTIENVYYKGNIDIVLDTDKHSASDYYATINIGGAIGMADYVAISNSYSLSNINVTNNHQWSNVGGLFGAVTVNPFQIKNVYATGNISADYISEIGKLVGNVYNINLGEYENIYTNVYQTGTYNKTYDFEREATIEEIWQFVYNNWDSEIWNLYLDKHPELK